MKTRKPRRRAAARLGPAARALLAALGLAASCSREEARPAQAPPRGARIDGSEDAPRPAPSESAAGEAASSSSAPDAQVPPAEGAPPAGDLASAAGSATAGADAPAEPAAEDAEAAPSELGTLRPDGVREIRFLDLSLAGLDPDELIDSLLFPDEYESLLPPSLRALDGQLVSIRGYMIPGKIAKGGNVRDFWLVRDLMACCFGGMPKPDEWIDVVMEEQSRAEYVRYVPMVVTGRLSVGSDIDEESMAPAVFKMLASEVRRED